jgi:hypothetical protein
LSTPRDTPVNRSLVSASPARLADRLADQLPVTGVGRCERIEVRPALTDVERIGLEPGASDHRLHRALGDATERGDSLSHLVDEAFEFARKSVEQFVQRNELRSLHVPVRLLRLQAKVDRIRKTRIEEFCHLRAGLDGEINAGAVHGVLLPAGCEQRRLSADRAAGPTGFDDRADRSLAVRNVGTTFGVTPSPRGRAALRRESGSFDQHDIGPDSGCLPSY